MSKATLTTPPPPSPSPDPSRRLRLTDKKKSPPRPSSMPPLLTTTKQRDKHDDYSTTAGLLFSIMFQRVQNFTLFDPRDLLNSVLNFLDRSSIVIVTMICAVTAGTSSFLSWMLYVATTLLQSQYTPSGLHEWLKLKLNFLPDLRYFDLSTYLAGVLFDQADLQHDNKVDCAELYSKVLLLLHGYGPIIASNLAPDSLRMGDLLLKPPSFGTLRRLFHIFDFHETNTLDREQFQLLGWVVCKLVVARILAQTFITAYSLRASQWLFQSRNVGGKFMLRSKMILPHWLYYLLDSSAQISMASLLSMVGCNNVLAILDEFYEVKVKREIGHYKNNYLDMRERLTTTRRGRRRGIHRKELEQVVGRYENANAGQ